MAKIKEHTRGDEVDDLTGAAKRLRDELIGAATRGTLRLTYGQFGDLVGLKPAFYVRFLDAIAKYQRDHEKPDVTYILVSKEFPYPSQIGGKLAKPPSSAQKRLAHQVPPESGRIERRARGAGMRAIRTASACALGIPADKINQTMDLILNVPGLVVRISPNRAAIPALSCDLIDCPWGHSSE